MEEQQQPAADDFAAFLAQHPVPSEVVEFSRTDGVDRKIARLRIRIPNMTALDLARARAFNHLTKPGRYKPADLGKPIPLAVMQDTVAREVLAEACCSVNPIPVGPHLEDAPPVYARTFRDAEQIGQLVSEADLQWLWAQYLRISEATAPVFVDEEGDEPEEETEDAPAE